MALGNDVYDVTEIAGGGSMVIDAGAGPTNSGVSGSHRRGIQITNGGGMMTKSNLRSVAYFAIVGGVVCWLVAHLAPIRG